jgi:hypothetical protein
MVRAELCKAPGDTAAVVVLHGCGGFSTFDHRLTAGLPHKGISTYDIDYFGPTPPPGKSGFCNADGRFCETFATWIAVAELELAACEAVPLDPGSQTVIVHLLSLLAPFGPLSATRPDDAGARGEQAVGSEGAAKPSAGLGLDRGRAPPRRSSTGREGACL